MDLAHSEVVALNNEVGKHCDINWRKRHWKWI